MKTVEIRTSEAVLQQPINVEILGKTYPVAPPSVATLILASAAISKMPAVNKDAENGVYETLAVAADCAPMGEVIAILVLGAKRLTETIKVIEQVEKTVERIVYDEYLFGLIKRPKVIEVTITEDVEKEVVIDRKSKLQKELLENLSPRQMNELMNSILAQMDIAFFLGTLISLSEINLTRAKRKTTASGQ